GQRVVWQRQILIPKRDDRAANTDASGIATGRRAASRAGRGENNGAYCIGGRAADHRSHGEWVEVVGLVNAVRIGNLNHALPKRLSRIGSFESSAARKTKAFIVEEKKRLSTHELPGDDRTTDAKAKAAAVVRNDRRVRHHAVVITGTQRRARSTRFAVH